jgi:hypothetical protein
MILDNELLTYKILHHLKSLPLQHDVLDSRVLEIIICESFGFRHVGDSKYYADGVTSNQQLSVKTIKLNPEIKKRKDSKDFQSHADKFLGPKYIKKHEFWINGPEIVQRRQKLDFINDATVSAEKIGTTTLKGFAANIAESLAHFNVKETWEVIVVHGYDKVKKSYIVSLFWKEYEFLDNSKIEWVREKSAVSGYSMINGMRTKICTRINGNSKNKSTCFIEYKNLIGYNNSANISVPIPQPWVFDKIILKEELDSLSKNL